MLHACGILTPELGQSHQDVRGTTVPLLGKTSKSDHNVFLCPLQLLEEAVSICEGRLQARQTQVVAYLDKAEDWTIEASSNKSGMCAQKSLIILHAHAVDHSS